METYRVQVTISKDGSLALQGLPFAHGDKVEVIVRRQKTKRKPTSPYPLRGIEIQYNDPLSGISTNDWEALG